MPEGVAGGRLGKLSCLACAVKRALEHGFVQVVTPELAVRPATDSGGIDAFHLTCQGKKPPMIAATP